MIDIMFRILIGIGNIANNNIIDVPMVDVQIKLNQ